MLKAGFGGKEAVCSLRACCPLLTSCFSFTVETPQNRGLQGEEVASILGPLPLAVAVVLS